MFTKIIGLRTYYDRIGTGTPYLLLHGWGGDSRNLRIVAEYVRDALDGTALVPDFPGFGLSDYPPTAWAVDDYVGFTLSFLDQLEIGKAIVVAHSFGGRVAIKLAAGHPNRVEKLILVDSAGIRPRRTWRYHCQVTVTKTTRKLVGVLPRFLANWFQKNTIAKLGSVDYQQAGALRPTFVKVVNEDLTPQLSNIRAPTLLIWGELDTATPLSDAEIMSKKITNSRLVRIKNAGHYCFVDDFPAFAVTMGDFLREPISNG